MNSVEFLENLLDGAKATPGDLDQLIHRRVCEDEYLDYKAGAWLDDDRANKKGKKASQELRRYVAGFANSNGGVLIVGIQEDPNNEGLPNAISGIEETRVGKKGAANWAAQSVSSLLGYLGRPPIIQEVQHSQGTVLIVAIERAQNLVPCIVNRQNVYHLRSRDNTFEAPAFLVGDLVTGTRARPTFDIEFSRLSGNCSASGGGTVLKGARFDIGVNVHNTSLTWAEEVHFGLFGYHAGGGSPIATKMYRRLLRLDADAKPDHIKAGFLDHQPPPVSGLWAVGSIPAAGQEILRTQFNLGVLSEDRVTDGQTWAGVAAVLSKTSLPTLFQVTIDYDSEVETGRHFKTVKFRNVVSRINVLPLDKSPAVRWTYLE